MNKEEIKQVINTLIMVTGDCPYDRNIGKEEDIHCENYSNCVDCWKKELFNALNRLEKMDKAIEQLEVKKNPFILTEEDIKEATIRYEKDISKGFISYMSEWQKYKNRYSRILMDAKRILKKLNR